MTVPNRLLVQLNNTGLQNKDTPLYQLLKALITTLTSINSSVEDINDTNASVIIGPTGIGIPGIDGIDGEDGITVVGLTGATGATGAQGPVGLPYIAEDGLEGDPFPPIEGPQGNPGTTGAQGPVGISVLVEDGLDGEDGFIINRSPTTSENTRQIGITIDGGGSTFHGYYVGSALKFITDQEKMDLNTTQYPFVPKYSASSGGGGTTLPAMLTGELAIFKDTDTGFYYLLYYDGTTHMSAALLT